MAYVIAIGTHVKSYQHSPPLEGACTQITLFVVPKSIPATVARPLKPILAIIITPSKTTPINDGIKASIPPDLESFWCLAVMDVFFFFLMIRLLLDGEEGCCVSETVEKAEDCLVHSCWRSFCLLRL